MVTTQPPSPGHQDPKGNIAEGTGCKENDMHYTFRTNFTMTFKLIEFNFRDAYLFCNVFLIFLTLYQFTMASPLGIHTSQFTKLLYFYTI